MTQNTKSSDEKDEMHPEIDEIVIEEDRLLTGIEKMEQAKSGSVARGGKYVIRLFPPFEARVRTDLHFDQDGNFYPPEGTDPIHISPEKFVEKLSSYPIGFRVQRRAEEYENGMKSGKRQRGNGCWIQLTYTIQFVV